MLCAHLDTVVPAAPIEPVLVDDGWENAHAGILGADNKAAVAVMLEVARHLVQRGAPFEVELLFTGEPITAADALKWGVINQVVPDGTARTATRPSAVHTPHAEKLHR